MTYATETMKSAINHSIQRAKELSLSNSVGWTESKLGEVMVNMVPVDHFVTNKNQSFRKTWKLNGKVISAAKLEKLLNDTAH